MRSSKYTAEALGPIVTSSRSYAEVLRKLGLPPTGGNYRMISARIRHASVDTSHFRRVTLASRCDALTTDELSRLVAQATSIAQVLEKLELPVEGRAHRELGRRIRELGIDTAHFRGPGWRAEKRRHHNRPLREVRSADRSRTRRYSLQANSPPPRRL